MPGYISEVSYMGDQTTDFIEVAIPAGTDTTGYSLVHYNKDGLIKRSYDLDTIQTTMNGQDVYVFSGPDAIFQKISEPDAYALVDGTGTVLQFISFGSTVTAVTGAANGLTSTLIGTTAAGESLQSDDGGATYYTQTAPNAGTIPCYAPGTLIDTPDGPRAVETLMPGDLVTTLDCGPQMIRWVRAGAVPLERAEPAAKPVLIKAGALGANLPARDLIVSPQHRVLVGAGGQLQQHFDAEAFAPAKSLTSLPGIRHMQGKRAIVWHHFACARHEVVIANGCRSESLLLGPMVVQGLTENQRAAVCELFRSGTGSAALNGPPARPCLKVGEARRRLTGARHRMPQAA